MTAETITTPGPLARAASKRSAIDAFDQEIQRLQNEDRRRRNKTAAELSVKGELSATMETP